MKLNFWRYADEEAQTFLGTDPLKHFQNVSLVKGNALREVWRNDRLFFKLDKRQNHGFRKEFANARSLILRGIPVVSHLACGRTEKGNWLITEALANSVPVEEYIAGRIPDENFLNGLINFLKLMEYRKIIHKDLHFGNILYLEQTNSFCLVDVRDARPAAGLEKLFYSRKALHYLLVELIENLSSQKISSLLWRMDVKEPEVLLEKALERKARLIQKEWPRRRQQILSGYPKFTRREGELLFTRGVHPEELENAEKIPGNAGLFAGAFYLDLVRIPHRRVLAFSEKESILWAEKLVCGDADSAAVADLRSRALKFGINSACRDWVNDASGIVKLSTWEEM